MIIGIEASTLGPRSTGTARYLKCILEQLEELGRQYVLFNGISSSPGKLLSKLNKIYYRNRTIKKDINSSGAGCVIFPDYYMPSGIRQNSAVIIHDLSFISHPRFYSKYFTAYYNYQIKNTLKQKPLIVTVSEHSKRNIVKYLGVDEEKILLVQGYSNFRRHGVIKDNQLKDYGPYLLYVGHIEPRKNLNFMTEGFLKWKNRTGSDLKLILTGEFWIKTKSTAELVRKYSDHPDIKYTGYIPENELESFYANASGFLHTSLEEGFGFPVLEAMHYGLPILCSEKIATGEISGPHSVKVDPENEDSYMKGLDNLAGIIADQKRIGYDIAYTPSATRIQLETLLDKLGAKHSYSLKVPSSLGGFEALQKTLLYSGIFNSGVKEEKLHSRIFDVKISKEELNVIINESILQGSVVRKEGSLFINYGGSVFYKPSDKKPDAALVRRLLRTLKRIPFISMIAFSGGTAHYGLFNHDDIDLFIITRQNAVYIVYFIIHIYSLLSRSRKVLCANYLIDETAADLSGSDDLFTAHQIISLVPFKNPDMLRKFRNANSWLKRYFPNFNTDYSGRNFKSRKYFLLKPANLVLLFLYRRLYKSKIGRGGDCSIILAQNSLKLHTNDHKRKVILKFNQVLEEYFGTAKKINGAEYDNRSSESVRRAMHI